MAVVNAVREWSSLPIIVLSARGHEADKVLALDAGADDYVSKPFSMAELLARVRAALRRRELDGGPEGSLFVAGELKVDLAARVVTNAEREVHLTPTEYRLLAVLVRHADKVVSHHQLLKEAWGPAYQMETEYLRVYIRQLRRKLENEPARPRHLLTEPGVGYRLRTEIR
jgi:two-component system KDP operon response regulator KdpE